MQEKPNVAPGAFSLREAADRGKKSRWFSSGSESLDQMLGGGFRTGEMIEVYGASATAKTQLALQAALSVASSGSSCAYVDTEGQFRPERLASISEARGMDAAAMLPRVYCVRAQNTRLQNDAISLVRGDENLEECRMVVVDTVTKNFTLEYAGPRMVASRQMALGAYLNRLARDAYAHDRAVLLLNRVASIGLEPQAREVDIGGDTLRHFVQKALHLRRRGDIVTASLDDSPRAAEVSMKLGPGGLS